jgi:hypothetical protein
VKRDHLDAFIGFAIVGALLTALALDLTRCGSATQDGGEAAYGAANTACVALSTTRTQAETCVDRVQAIWCGDGGLWSSGDAGLCASGKDGH